MAQDKVAEIIKFTGAGEPPAPAQPVAPPQPVAPAAADEAVHAGALLAAAREAAGLSVEAVSDAIKLKAAHVAAIEAMRADLLPAMPYAVGFVRTYARFLNLDAEAVAARFRAEIAGAAPAAVPASPEAASEAATGNEGARLAWVFAIFVIVLFALWVIVQVLSGAGNPTPAPEPGARVTAPQAAPAPAVADPAPEISAEDSQPAEDMALGEALDDAPQADAAGETSDAAANDGAAPIPATPVPPPPPEAQPRQTPPAGTAQQAAPGPASAPQERPLPRRPRPEPPARAPAVVPAALVRSPAPAYPDRCTRAARDLESVTVGFDVSPQGRAVNARILSSTNPCFETEALNVMQRWRFTPRTVDGEAALEAGKSATLNFRK